jgi:hypothetical protein
MKKFIKFYKAFYKHEATKFQKEEVEFKHDLEHAQRDLQNANYDHELQQRLGHLRSKLQDFEELKVASQTIQAKIRWKLKGNFVAKNSLQY